MFLAERLAKEGLKLSFSDLSSAEVHAAKRAIMDTLGCGIGGFNGESSKIVQSFVRNQGGPKESTVIGSGLKVSCQNATFANGAMVRYLDYNDTYLRVNEKLFAGWHPSEIIPAVLAVGERQHASGKDVLTAVAFGYDIIGRFVDSITCVPLSLRGWHMSTLAGFVIPIAVGKIMGLDTDQIVNAMGIAGTFSPTLGIIDAPGDEYNMTKNIGVAHAAQASIMAGLLAQKGFTGPKKAIEGKRGLVESVLEGDFDSDILVGKKRDCATVLRTVMKYYAAETSAQGSLTAIIKLVNEHNILPDQVKEVTVELTTRGTEHIGDPAKRYPRNKETADHSMYYLAAAAILERSIGIDSYSFDKYTNPKLVNIIDKVTVKENPDLNKYGMAGIVHVIINGNKRFSERVDYPKGHYRNPMTDDELENKFQDITFRFLHNKQVRHIIDKIYHFEELDDVSDLMQLLIFQNKT